jgi:ABC-2 type transport system permease protein
MGDPGSRENPRYKGKEATYLDPLRYFWDVLRGVYLKGIGLDVLWIQLTAMGVFGTAMLAISVFIFRKSLV